MAEPYPYHLMIEGDLVDDGNKFPGRHYYAMPADQDEALRLATLADRLLLLDNQAFDTIDMSTKVLTAEEVAALVADGQMHSTEDLLVRIASAFIHSCGPVACPTTQSLLHITRGAMTGLIM